MESAQVAPQQGELNWRLSSHPITLLSFLAFRIASPLVYILGMWFTKNFVLVFIITIVLLAADFYYLKNIAGRRLVGLRWWNEVDTASGDGRWVFESADPETRQISATDKRFFWLSLYVQPAIWIALAIVAIVKFEFIWLTLVDRAERKWMLETLADGIVLMTVIALTLTVTNTLAFSRCDKFSQATNFAGSAFYSGGIAKSIASNMVSRLWR
ncbi:Golgi apparatus membrane protein [Neofusicoccum parvum]|uniref:Golgi apparatus membrane protein n=1 Tax=Neofusicoccum parvum TaxID=310453 RepID=A0ACB5RPI7_9PEZI|nr:Golgi apparatus membrane protein [Neofusicoccum parvum]